MKEMKYKLQIDTIQAETKTNCTGETFLEEDRIAYRWTFDDINHPNNFVPRAKLVKGNENDCGGWALSFFTTEQLAIDRLNYFCSHKRHLYKKLGTHIAEGQIEKSDGVNGDFHPNNGHFSHFEYSGTDFSKKFSVKTKIY